MTTLFFDNLTLVVSFVKFGIEENEGWNCWATRFAFDIRVLRETNRIPNKLNCYRLRKTGRLMVRISHPGLPPTSQSINQYFFGYRKEPARRSFHSDQYSGNHPQYRLASPRSSSPANCLPCILRLCPTTGLGHGTKTCATNGSLQSCHHETLY